MDSTEVRLRSPQKNESLGWESARPILNLSPHARLCHQVSGRHSTSRTGELRTSPGEASPGPLPGDPGPTQPGAAISAGLFPSPPTPSPSAWL